MDKISNVIHGNARVKTVDMDDAHPIRPGTPSFGRPNGLTVSSRERLREAGKEVAHELGSDRVSLSSDAQSLQEAAKSPQKDVASAQIADQVAQSFADIRTPTAETRAQVTATSAQAPGAQMIAAVEPLPSTQLSNSIDKYA